MGRGEHIFRPPEDGSNIAETLVSVSLATGLGLFMILGVVDWYVWQERLYIATIATLPVVTAFVLLGYVYHRDLSSSLLLRALQWMVGGIAVLGGIIVVVAAVDNDSLVEMFPILQFMIGVGGTAGLGIGFMEARSIERARQAEHERELLLFLNKLLRHNVLNSVQAIEGYSSMLLDRDTENAAELRIIETNSRDIATLVENVRVLVDAAIGEQSTYPTELSAHLSTELDSLRSSYPGAVVEAELPSAVYVQANSFLRYAFNPLLYNAVEHNDADTPTVSVSVGVGEETVVVSVADNGPGLSEERRMALASRPREGDQGIGLYMAKTLVLSYGGRLWATDNDPRGLVVHVELPLATAPMEHGSGSDTDEDEGAAP